MTSPKKVSRYNRGWFDLFDRIKEDLGGTIELECGTEQKASAVRLEFYKVREAITGGDPTKRSPEGQDLFDRYEVALDSREVKVVGTKCVFAYKDSNWIGRILEQVEPPM